MTSNAVRAFLGARGIVTYTDSKVPEVAVMVTGTIALLDGATLRVVPDQIPGGGATAVASPSDIPVEDVVTIERL